MRTTAKSFEPALTSWPASLLFFNFSLAPPEALFVLPAAAAALRHLLPRAVGSRCARRTTAIGVAGDLVFDEARAFFRWVVQRVHHPAVSQGRAVSAEERRLVHSLSALYCDHVVCGRGERSEKEFNGKS